jgi:hypothetical protein
VSLAGSSPVCRPARRMRVFRGRSREQRLHAPQLANDTRSARARLKKDLASGIELAQILARPAECVRTARVRDVLLVLPKIGSVKAARILGRLRHRSPEDARRPDRAPANRTAEPLTLRQPRQVTRRDDITRWRITDCPAGRIHGAAVLAEERQRPRSDAFAALLTAQSARPCRPLREVRHAASVQQPRAGAVCRSNRPLTCARAAFR